MDRILVLVGSTILIAGIVWWFFGKKQSVATAATQNETVQTATITVDGGYAPNLITLHKGKTAHITFIRKDPSGCLEEVILPDFGIATKLPVNQPFEVTILPNESGVFTYTCGMRMFSGRIEVI